MLSGFTRLALLVLIACCLAGISFALPAFPGAEGAGSDTVGGRGGQVFIVDNLNPNGAGSFQNAVDGLNVPRIVVFRTSGIIYLAHDLTIDKPYLTVAGQTAPGSGICIKGYAVMLGRTHDIVIRHIRFRPGDISGNVPSIWNGGSLPIDACYNILIDHCSMSWSVDENTHIYGGSSTDPDTTNITMQYCIFSEPLNDSNHADGPHGCNLLIRTDGGTVSIHHCLFVHGDARNPRLGSDTSDPTHRTLLDFRNNVIYNWGDSSGHGGGKNEYTSMNYIGNWVKSGPSTYDHTNLFFYSGVTDPTKADRYQIYKSDNYLNGSAPSGWTGFSDEYTQLASPLAFPAVTTQAVLTAKADVLANAGATLPARDSVDARAVSNVTNGNGSIIDSQTEVGGWPTYNSTTAPTDSDNDGMPNSWETLYGFNPNDANDQDDDPDGDGYTNIEEYINGTDPHVTPVELGSFILE